MGFGLFAPRFLPVLNRTIDLKLGSALDLVFPEDCVLCGERIPPRREGMRDSYPLCAACESALRPIEGPRCPRCGKALISERGLCMGCRKGSHDCAEVVPIYRYAGDVAALMAAYKSDGRRRLAHFWALRLGGEIDARWPDRTIVPVPPRPEKLESGCFDQVGALADRLESSGHAVARPLRRMPGSAQQKRLSREARAGNSRAAYVLRQGARVPDRALLLDDVCTTGATLDACARILIESGSLAVSAIVVAAD